MIPGMNTTQGGVFVTMLDGHRITLIDRRHELASHLDKAANDDRVDRGLALGMRVVAVVLAASACAIGWTVIGCPGLSALGLN